MLLTVIFILLAHSEIYAQCAMCKAAAKSSIENNPKSVAKGLNRGILFLMSIPYLAVGLIFRNEIRQFFRNLFDKEKTPINKKSLGNLTFLITFLVCATLLFSVFVIYYKGP